MGQTGFPKLLALERKLEWPMLLLSFLWLCVLIAELASGSRPGLMAVGTVIWSVFILYFAMRLLAADHRMNFFRKNWLFVAAILVSALRFFPFLQSSPLVRGLTATFGIQVVWIFASADQGMRFLRELLGRRGAGYALALTSVVLVAGAAGMVHFEGVSTDPQTLQTYPKALWWTAMQMTNIGSSYSIRTVGGRILCLGISVYSAVMFGYLTALVATFLIDREAKEPKLENAHQKSVQEIHDEVVQLRRRIEDLIAGLQAPKTDHPES
jgi:voltage-gated potassium channel